MNSASHPLTHSLHTHSLHTHSLGDVVHSFRSFVRSFVRSIVVHCHAVARSQEPRASTPTHAHSPRHCGTMAHTWHHHGVGNVVETKCVPVFVCLFVMPSSLDDCAC